jgi:hypothetical protein
LRKANQVKELTAAVTSLNAQIEALKTQNTALSFNDSRTADLGSASIMAVPMDRATALV